jgi:hypothetical protein
VRPGPAVFLLALLAPWTTFAADTTQPTVGRLPDVEIDAAKKQVRVQCETLNAQMPLEFFCVTIGGPEHESVLRTSAKPSDVHFGLLALGLTPGEPARYDQPTDTWYPPIGPPLSIFCTFKYHGQLQTMPANRLVRSVKTHQEMPPQQWVFDGSRVLPDGQYAANLTGYVVSIVNFDMTMIDVPELASNSNETLEWEYNPDIVPMTGTPVTLIIEPAQTPTTQPAKTLKGSQFFPGPGLHPDSGLPSTQPG